MRVDIRLPLPAEQVFRYEAMDDILEITAQNPSTEFSNRELQELTEFGGPSVSKALTLLGQLELIDRRDVGKRTLYRINEQRLYSTDDPFLSIPQAEFRTPLRSFVERVETELSTLAGIVCFGSVARGEADRISDIDLFVLVDTDDELVQMRRTVSDIKRDLEAEPFDGQRYEFEIFVESDESSRRRGRDLQLIFQEGITLYETETLRQVKGDVFGGDSE
ncbi:nucleotidyltransferase domain-containing protein [Natronorubrum texcoconense]|uniref:Nucleotidyltransferase domain-containing protein n=1 Tax=Natronorubrum texcoconense TaxID=1095776 RepID=A0A1G8Y2C0_9EURY|nr:nucleotidyltransferase domain-containing protein [Natronorubrum texcoconense]SDJ96863.1 Nucleotidyltransferase domain-containing protein [Natronorubrum texcoconense]